MLCLYKEEEEDKEGIKDQRKSTEKKKRRLAPADKYKAICMFIMLNKGVVGGTNFSPRKLKN